MYAPVLSTKLYIPPPRPGLVLRPRLVEHLNEGLLQNQGFGRKLTLISAPAGFGKTTLVSEWVHERMKAEGGRACPERAIHGSGEGMKNVKKQFHPSSFIPHPSRFAWLSLDEEDNDPYRFLVYLVSALQTLDMGGVEGAVAEIGEGLLNVLQSPQPPPVESILATLLNEISTLQNPFVLVLDDYHMIDSKPVDRALNFLLEHLPPRMHLVIATREDPGLPLPRLRARGQLTELRAADLRFTPAEAAEFLNQVMGLDLSAEDVDALETRTEGWIAGLQLAALALQGLAQPGPLSMHAKQDTTSFIRSFTGSHHFVMDYLVEEVLGQQPERIQAFLLRTSILDRLCGSLCDAVVGTFEGWNVSTLSPRDHEEPAHSSEQRSNVLAFKRSYEILEYLERANLFIVPLDNERRWYRYHHLFADLLRQRLHQRLASTTGDAASRLNELHIRASLWYEENGLAIEAFRHAAAANDIGRAVRFIGGDRIPQHFSGAVTPILAWLESLPRSVLDERPWLWWRYASLLLVNGQTIGVEEKLQAAEAAPAAAALQGTEGDGENRNLIGLIATARSVLALTRYQVDAMLAQSRRALEHLHPDSRISRSTAYWTMGYAHLLLGDRPAARQAFMEAISISRDGGDIFTTILATIGLGNVQEADNELHHAAETYRRVLQLAGDQPQQIIHEAHLGLGRILFEWNDLDAAEEHGRQALHLARQYERVIDRFIICEVFLSRLKLARGDVPGAAALLDQASQSARQGNFLNRLPEVAAGQVPVLLRQGNLEAAADLAQTFGLPLSLARVHLAQGNPSAALAVLVPYRKQMEAKGWLDERLKVMVPHALALSALGERDEAGEVLGDALALAEPGDFIRLFLDEGQPMEKLLARMKDEGERARSERAIHGSGEGMKEYIHKLLAAFQKQIDIHPSTFIPQPLIEPMSQRELEVLRLIAQGLSNREIGERLFLALDTVKGHNRNIYGKLQVQRRTEAVARARELGLL